MSDNIYYVKYHFVPDISAPTTQDRLQIFLKPFEGFYPLRRSLDGFAFVNEHLPAVALHQRTKTFSHAPAHVAQNLQAVYSWDEKSKAVIAENADSFGKAIEGLEFEAGQIKALELFFRQHADIIDL